MGSNALPLFVCRGISTCLGYWKAARHWCIMVAKKTSLKGIVKTGLEKTKGCGARKLNIYLKDKYSGISTQNVQKVLDRSRRFHLHRATVQNKAIPKPIRAKTVQERQQFDLLNMGKWAVKCRNIRYRYIVTILDVCGYALWRASKRAKRLLNISLQSSLNMAHPRFCSKNSKVQSRGWWNPIRSKSLRTLHTTTRAKVKTHTHRVLHRKIMYDFVNFKRGGVNWAAHICQFIQELWIWTKKSFSTGCLLLKCIMGGRITSGLFTYPAIQVMLAWLSFWCSSWRLRTEHE